MPIFNSKTGAFLGGAAIGVTGAIVENYGLPKILTYSVFFAVVLLVIGPDWWEVNAKALNRHYKDYNNPNWEEELGVKRIIYRAQFKLVLCFLGAGIAMLSLSIWLGI